MASSSSSSRRLLLLCCCALFLSFPFFFLRPSPMPVPSYAEAFPHNCDGPFNITERTARGARLAHSWPDEELFDRAVTMETLLPQQDLPARESYVSQLPSYLFNSSTSDELPSRGRRRSSCRGKTLTRSSRPPKIAFLFLTTGALPFASLWNLFFRGHEQFYNIYVHLDPFRVGLFDRSSGEFWGRLIPSDTTNRGTPSLIAAERRLLANALLDDPLNEYFAVLSDHCIPLYGFRSVYQRVTTSDQSFIEILDKSPTLHARYVARGADIMLPEVPFLKFRVGSQFFILIRKHAVMVVADKKYWNKFRLPCRNANTCYVEEHYFPTLIEMEDGKCSTRYTVTYVDWSRTARGHPKTFGKDEINKDLLKALRKQKNGRFLFARKFQDECLVNLLQLAPLILEH